MDLQTGSKLFLDSPLTLAEHASFLQRPVTVGDPGVFRLQELPRCHGTDIHLLRPLGQRLGVTGGGVRQKARLFTFHPFKHRETKHKAKDLLPASAFVRSNEIKFCSTLRSMGPLQTRKHKKSPNFGYQRSDVLNRHSPGRAPFAPQRHGTDGHRRWWPKGRAGVGGTG